MITGAPEGWEVALERVVGVAHIRMRQHCHAFGQCDMLVQLDPVGQIQQALFAQKQRRPIWRPTKPVR